MKKNIFLIFFSFLFSSILVYFLIFTWVAVFEKYKHKNNFTNLENLNFHEEYSNKIHHLRSNNWPNKKKNFVFNKKDYLFSTVSEFKTQKDNYLLQGDSWAEYMIFKDQIYEACKTIVHHEDAFIDLAFQMGSLEGLTAEEVKQYIRFIGNRRLEQLGLNPIYDVKKNPLTWLDTMLNGVEHMNFFEGRATEYSKASTKGTWGEVFA